MPYLPALLLALFAFWAGNFVQGATGLGAIAGHAALGVVLILLGGRGGAFTDPLRLGRAGRFLPFAALVAAVASPLASPVPRTGQVGILVALLLLFVAPVLARSFERDPARAAAAVSAVVVLVSLYALAASLAGRSARPALPLGHHTLLAAWLAMLLPLAALPAFERTSRSEGAPSAKHSGGIALGAGAALIGLLALLASRSAAGLLAVAAQAAIAPLFLGGRRARKATFWLALALLLLLVPRAVAILSGHDPSAAARQVYWRAGVAGFAERPLLGWGPGATPWTIAPFLRPIPGANPPGEAVGELHSLPLTIAYELGGTGLALAGALALAFLLRRIREEREAPDSLRRAGLLGLLGGAIASLGTGAWSVAALPVAAVIAASAALAPSRGSTEPSSVTRIAPARRPALARAIGAASLLLLAPFDLGHLDYDRAIGTDPRRSIEALDEALASDPSFGLYRARRAAYRARTVGEDAEEAWRAARDAGDVAPLWLLAGELGVEARRPWSGAALDRACRAAPFDGIAPWLRLSAAPPADDPVSIAARAFLAEPKLLQAVQGPPLAVRRQAVARIEHLPGLDRGWRRALVLAARRSLPSGPISFLTFGAETPDGSFSLHWFRRLPWGAYLGGVALRGAAPSDRELPAATRLPTTAASLFDDSGCRLGATSTR